MLEELAARTGAAGWAIASMLFFVASWVGVAVWAARKPTEELDALARFPLDDEGGTGGTKQARG